MSTARATAEAFWIAFKALPKVAQNDFIERLMHDRRIRKDFVDIAIVHVRRSERGRSFSDYLAERRSTRK